MSTHITWFGHNCWSIETGGKTILLDPFLDESPTAPVKAADVRADFILVSHGHFDHVADAAPIAKRTGATVLASFEVGQWLPHPGPPGGVRGGFLPRLADARVYFACDTALFLDMKLIGAGGLDLAVLPIGDLFTMGPDDAIEAVKLLQPKRVVPDHYNTWPPIEQDPRRWAER